MSKKRMAFVDLSNFKNWPAGGMLEYELTLLNYLHDYFEIDLWGMSVDGKSNRQIEVNGVKHPIHIWGNAKTKKKIIPNYWRGLSIKRKKKSFPKDYDFVYVHTGSCAVALSKMIDRSKTKLIYHQHGLSHLHDYALMSLMQRPLVNLAQKVSDIVFVVSDEESVSQYANTMKTKSNARCIPVVSPIILDEMVMNNVKQKIERNKNRDTEKFIYTGRLDSHKDVMTVIEAFNIYHRQKNNTELVIVGEGDERINLVNKVDELGIADCVTFTGAVPHDKVKEYLSEAEAYLTASIGEGMSIAVLEAYEYGLPVVCFKVPGLEKQVVDGVSGIIAKDHSAQGMYEAMLVANKKRSVLALGCLKEVRKYNAKDLAEYIAKNIMEGDLNAI